MKNKKFVMYEGAVICLYLYEIMDVRNMIHQVWARNGSEAAKILKGDLPDYRGVEEVA